MCIRCNRDQMTSIIENGLSQTARFSFPAFRFTEQQNQTVSSYYLHCITRLCESSVCATYRVSINLALKVDSEIHISVNLSTKKQKMLAKTYFNETINKTKYKSNINDYTESGCTGNIY